MNNDFAKSTIRIIKAIEKYKDEHGEDGVIEEYYKTYGSYRNIESFLEEKESNKCKN
jgi:hypothetical protein